jgi:tetratricopeptide (TPR) repeat protein
MVTSKLIPVLLLAGLGFTGLPFASMGMLAAQAAQTSSSPSSSTPAASASPAATPSKTSASKALAKKPTASQAHPADGLQEAETLLRNQQYAAAEEKLKLALVTYPKVPQAWFDLGFAQSHQHKTQDAITSYRKAVELAPKWFEAQLNLGVALFKSGNAAAAEPVLRLATELTPLSGGDEARGSAWLALAEVREQMGAAAKDTAAAYDQAFSLEAGGPELLVKSGLLLANANDAAGAEAHFQKAAEAGDSGGMVQLVKLLVRQQRYADAENWLGKYVAQNPDDATARVEYSRLLASENKKAEAIAALQSVKQPYPKDVAIELAELYLANKQYKDAESLLRPLLEANAASGQPSPTKPDAQLVYDLGLALLYQLKYSEAETMLLQALRLKPDLTEGYVHLADAARESQHYELSIKAIDEYVRRAGETPKTYFIRATNYDHLKMYKPAVENYKHFLEVSGGKYPDQEFQARHRLKAIQP